MKIRHTVGMALMLVIGLVSVGTTLMPVGAHTDGGLGPLGTIFEIDGNTPDDSPPGIDWDTTPGDEEWDTIPFTDGVAPNDPTTFDQGSKWQEPGGDTTEFGWTCGAGNVPKKGDIVDGQIAVKTIGGTQYLAANFSRVADNGDVHLDYEFNQLSTPNDGCTDLPDRSTGDLVIAFDTSTGGQNMNLSILEWQGDANTGSFVPAADIGDRHVTWDGAVGQSTNQFAGTFGEVLINLTDTLGDIECGEFATVHMSSRSSTSPTAAMQDYTLPETADIGECAQKDWAFTFETQPWAGASVDAVYTVNADDPDDATTRRLTLEDEDESGSFDGVFEGTDAFIPPGALSYHFEIFSGETLVYTTTSATETLAVNEVRLNTGSFDYDLTLSADAENFVGDPHTFTATVAAADSTALSDIPVQATLVHDCGALYPDDDSPTDGPGTDTLTGLTTNGSGQVTFRVKSDTTCTAQVEAAVVGSTATYVAPEGSASAPAGEPRDTASKAFVDFFIDVSPATAFNEADADGSDHTFTVTVTKDHGDGNDPQPVAGAVVSLELIDNTANANITGIQPSGTINDPATTGTCTTDSAGECDVTVTSTQTGSVTLKATTTQTAGGRSVTKSSEGDKSFVVFDLDVDPPEADNEVGDPHTFTITLTRDDGSGPVRLEGEVVSFSLSGNETVTVTDVADRVDGADDKCLTRANDPATADVDEAGTCTVTINATDPGAVTLTASYDTTLDDGTSDQDVHVEESAEKRFHAFELSVSPTSADNEVGDDHTFTIRLTVDSGSGPTGLPGEDVSFTLDTSDNSGAHLVSINGADADGTTGTCTTLPDDDLTPEDEAGTCVVVVDSDSPGTVGFDATWQDQSVGTDATATSHADKRFIDYRLTLTPEDVENEVGDAHTFTVLLERATAADSDGEPVWQAYGDQQVDVTLDTSENPSAEITAVGGDPSTIADDGSSASCTTSSSGTCTVTIDSDDPGDVVLTATWGELVDEQTGSSAQRSDTATKHFIAFDLDIAPDAAENFVDQAHEFTLLLTRDDGDGPTAYAGQQLSFTLTRPDGSDATITTVDGGPSTIADDELSGTCTTRVDDEATSDDEAGTCVVTASSGGTTGQVTLDASWDDTLNEGTDDAKSVSVDADPATKLWVDFRVDVFPDDALNERDAEGSDHIFDITVEKDSGSGFVAVPGADVTVEMTTNTADASFTAVELDPGGNDLPTQDPVTCTTDTDGICHVTVTSTQTGTVEIEAVFSTENDGGTGTFDSTGSKTFVDFELTLEPETARNEVGAEHVFTATLEQKVDETGGFQPLAGEQLVFDFDESGLVPASAAAAPDDGDDDPLTCETDSAGECTLTVSSDDPGTITVTVSYDDTIDNGRTEVAVHREDTATKVYEAYELTVTPATATNIVGHAHTMIVTLTRDVGDGPEPYVNQPINLSFTATDSGITVVSVNDADPSDPLSCTTRETDDSETTDFDERGTCEVVITSDVPGQATLTATWQTEEGVGTVDGTHTASGEKVFVDVTITKVPCAETTPPGSRLTYDITITISDGLEEVDSVLTDVSLVDTLPGQTTGVAASSFAGVDPVLSTDGTEVLWDLDSPLSEGTYELGLVVDVAETATEGTELVNSVTLFSNEGSVTTQSDVTTVTTDGADADARAYGVHVDLLGTEVVPPTPDTDEGGSALLAQDLGVATIGLLQVTESTETTSSSATSTGLARAVGVSISPVPALRITADAVVARSESTATGATATSSHGGSAVLNLTINGTQHGDITEPTNIVVRNPLTGAALAEVHVLELVPEGSAAGEAQPDTDRLFGTGLTVRGLRVTLNDDLISSTTTEVVVSHAESLAEFPSTLGCGATAALLSANAYVADLDVDTFVGDPLPPELASVLVGNVDLPSTGGDEQAHTADVFVDPALAESTTGFSHVWGDIDDDPIVGPDAHAFAEVEDLSLFDGAITATALTANTDSSVDSTVGNATIANLVIDGNDICTALGLDPVCTPEPNTDLVPDVAVIIRLNEHIFDAEDQLSRVNALHIWVVGEDNPFGLPVGAELVVSSAHSHAGPADLGEASTDGLVLLAATSDEPPGDLGTLPLVAFVVWALAAVGVRRRFAIEAGGRT